MKLQKEHIEAYQKISKNNFGKEVSYEVANEKLSNAVSFVVSVLKIYKENRNNNDK